MWRPNTLLEAIEAGESITVALHRDGRRYLCPNCSTPRIPAVIVDVRHLPIPEEWACDCCWTGWERTGRVVDGGFALEAPAADPQSRVRPSLEWRRRWVTAHGAPPEVVRKFERTT